MLTLAELAIFSNISKLRQEASKGLGISYLWNQQHNTDIEI